MAVESRPASPPARIVLVDDDDDLRALLSTAFNGSPAFDVVGTAGDGDTALRVVEQTQPDVVLLDLSMPDRGGLSTLTQLRGDSSTARVIVCSGLPGDEVEHVVRLAGATGYVRKAGSARSIVLEVEAILNSSDETQLPNTR